MASIRRPAVGAVALTFAAALACAGDEPEPKAQVVDVPLASVHLTFGQKGAKLVELIGDERRETWASKTSTWARTGASNVFLVRGGSIEEAAEATHEVLRRGKSAETPATPRKGAEGQPYWLVAHLGRHEIDLSAFQFRSARRTGKVIRLDMNKRILEESNKSRTIISLAWVPLGKLPDGTYRLEMYVNSEAEPELVRRVVVKGKN